MRKACANCLYAFYLGDYPNCFCRRNDKNVTASGYCQGWEQRSNREINTVLTDSFWRFVADGLAKHNAKIKELKGGEE